MIVDKMNMDSFREAMNNSYLPGGVAVASNSNPTNTVKSFEDQSFNKEFNKDFNKEFNKELDNIIGRKDDSSYMNSVKPDDRVYEREHYRDNEPNRTRDQQPKDADQHLKNQQDKINPDDNPNNIDTKDKKQHSTETQKPSDQEQASAAQKNGNTDKTVQEQKDGAQKPNGEIKELIKQQIAQAKELGNVKENAKENFSENKSATTPAQMQKSMLKNLENQHSKQTGNNNENSQNSNENSQNNKSNNTENDVNLEQRLKDPNIEKNESKTSFKQELKTAKKNTAPDLTFNLLDNIKDPLQLNNVKIKKILAQQNPNLLEQYQGIKEKITGSVENSIKMLVANGENRVTMNLHPPELGKVQIELVIKDSQITAKINTENIAVKEVIMTNLDLLKSNLANAGTQVNKFDVEVGGFKSQFEQQMGFNRESTGNGNGKGGNKRGYQSGQDPNDLKPGQIMNHKALTFFLGRSINCLI